MMASVLQIRVLFSERNSGASSDLAAIVRAQVIGFVQKEHPEALPRHRNENRTMPAAQLPAR